jgi:DTW domain-containing protein YfiP
MARSVVLAGTVRCEHCMLPPRWCICHALEPVVSPLQVDVLLHFREQWRPTSTGKLIERAVHGSRTHIYRRDVPKEREALVEPGRELWILHPRGEPLSALGGTIPDAAGIQVLLLDGSWGEASRLMRGVERWGRPVCLPLSGPSRYLLREQQGEGNHSTIEALLGLMGALGLAEAEARLRLHFELHVYATLRARGRKAQATEYLETSPVRTALPELLDRLHARRPNETSVPRKPAGVDGGPAGTL